jgi:hypothetical protein
LASATDCHDSAAGIDRRRVGLLKTCLSMEELRGDDSVGTKSRIQITASQQSTSLQSLSQQPPSK